MDWLFRPLLFFGLFAFVLGKECLMEDCSNKYHLDMEVAELEDPERSPEYCEIASAYKKCMKQMTRHCRGDLSYYGALHGIEKIMEMHCSTKTDSAIPAGSARERARTGPITTTRQMLPSCRYFGNFKFRHCGLYGDPHLKTFNGMYQTCRVSGTWTLIDNPYMSVQVTSNPVVGGSQATAPIKISIVVKGSASPCTLEKKYVAESATSLPLTFTDLTDRSGPDETVTLRTKHYDNEDRESAEIVMKYIASRLIIRRKGKYLAFNAKLPDEVVQMSKSYDEFDKVELCTTGCPSTELLDIVSARGHQVEREEALRLCKNTENLSNEIANNLTDSYLDWCVFDVMTAGKNKDFIDAAHSAQSDALTLDLNSLQNRTTLLEIPYDSIKFNSAPTTRSFQLPFCITSLIILLIRFLVAS